jgi:hypothetical protein
VVIQLDARDLMTPEADEQAVQAMVVVGDECFRLPSSRDLAEVSAAGDENKAAMRLLERCRVSGLDSPTWSDETLEQIEESMASADPMAEVRLALCCPVCDHEWEETLNIAAFVWAAIEARARRLFWEVHALASAYGWTESEALALSAPRRALYLEMVQA